MLQSLQDTQRLERALHLIYHKLKYLEITSVIILSVYFSVINSRK